MVKKREKTLISYKGFNQDLTCRGFQYEIGKEYEMDGNIKCCKRGFHACESPFEVLNYYFIDKNFGFPRFCEVEQSGILDKDGEENTKIASSKIKIKTELEFDEFTKLCYDWTSDKIKHTPAKHLHGDGDHCYVNISSNDEDALIVSSGHATNIASSGADAKIDSSGNIAHIGSSGLRAQIASNGDYSKIASSGDSAKIAIKGYRAQIVSNGDYSKIVSSYPNAQIASTGDYSQIASSGAFAEIAINGATTAVTSSGYRAKISESGCFGVIASSGDFAQIASSGDSAKIASSGEYSVVCCAGHNSAAKAKKGSWITLTEWVYNKEEGCYIPKCVKTEYVDGERIKEDTWYKLVDGEFKEISCDQLKD